MYLCSLLKRKTMTLIKRTLTGLIFITLVILSFFLPPLYAFLLFGFFAMVGTYEFIKMCRTTTAEPVAPLTMILAGFSYCLLASTSLCSTFDTLLSALLIFGSISMILILLLFTLELYRKKHDPILNIATSLLPIFWIVLPLSLVVFWAHTMVASNVVLATFIFIWAYDTFAYCGGTLFGKHRLFERISPKKSWEGAITAFILTSVAAGFFPHIPLFAFADMTTMQWIGLAWVIMVTATFGDLVESLFKRSCKIKDSGKILPGHGGILDRFDSLFFAAPAAFIYWLFIVEYSNL